ncbi:UvrD-helicase domain-containing protein [bacterium]|nr:UvrD-helicase domain-containing protein [bacterium]
MTLKTAMTTTFIEAMGKLPKQQQRRVRDFLKKWESDPKSASINYEKIHDVRDSRVRTVRIDQKYRAVVLHPEKGGTYVLVWVDNHDESMAWAKNKLFDPNPATGAFQIINVDEVERVASLVEKESVAPTTKSIFPCDDAELVAFGVLEVLLPAVRAIKREQDIQTFNGILPEDVVEALLWLAAGLPPDEIRELIGANSQIESEPTIEESLDNENSKRHVVRIKSVEEFEKILDAPLEKWRLFLHPSQSQLATGNFPGPTLVTGGAGTGKTVVAMHRVKYLLENVFTQEDDRILFTTYTANLASNLKGMLADLCGENASRLEVRNLDSWAVGLLRENGENVKIASNDEVNQAWDLVSMDAAYPFDSVFLKNEWDFASAKMGVNSKVDYLSMSRIGRPISLDRMQKSQVWSAFEQFHQNLKKSGTGRWEDVINRANELVLQPKYKCVVVDEAQDFQAPSWRLIRSLAESGSNDLFIVGDERQRIYGQAVNLSESNIDLGVRLYQLKINYRTTEQIQRWAFDQLTDIDTPPIAGSSGSDRSKSLLSGPFPELIFHDNKEEELAMLSELIPELLRSISPEEIVVTARAKWLLKDYVELLELLQVPFTVLDKKSDEDTKGIRIATMHRIKGLEFRVVILVSANEGVVPDTYRGREDDKVAVANHQRKERSLLYVAATRARERAIISTSGKPSPLLVN